MALIAMPRWAQVAEDRRVLETIIFRHYAADARIAAEHVQNRHAATSRADLEHMRHCFSLVFGP